MPESASAEPHRSRLALRRICSVSASACSAARRSSAAAAPRRGWRWLRHEPPQGWPRGPGEPASAAVAASAASLPTGWWSRSPYPQDRGQEDELHHRPEGEEEDRRPDDLVLDGNDGVRRIAGLFFGRYNDGQEIDHGFTSGGTGDERMFRTVHRVATTRDAERRNRRTSEE